MSYVHCAGCHCAFDAAACRRCPRCGHRLGRGAAAGAVEDEVADATAQLARALSRATPAELDALVARITTAEGSGPHAAPVASTSERWAEVVLCAVGGAVAEQRGTALAVIEPATPRATEPPPGVRALVGALAIAVGAQVAAQLATLSRARALPRLPAPAGVGRRAFALARRVRAAFA